MAVEGKFAHGTLIRVAQLQAQEVDDWRNAQPGKMLISCTCKCLQGWEL
ncbi:MAG: hypothetical protein SAK29_17775 [Scytonema sp. PMC 1069.18]|nr:hypothetical protein [Scytonema sp. PMC 1069.18]MEC4880809.1 hypothetical protein [Scytonema sp. PMC 1070.18]